MLPAGRTVRLSGLRLWTVLLAKDGACLSRHTTFEEERVTDDRLDSRVHGSLDDVAGDRGCGVEDQCEACGLGELLQFGSGQPGIYHPIDRYATLRLHQWLCRKHKRRGSGRHRFSDAYLHEKLGLVRVGPRTRNLPWAAA